MSSTGASSDEGRELPARRSDPPEPGPNQPPQDPQGVGAGIPPEGVDRLAALVFAKIENRLEQHLHLPSELPPIDQAAEMREKAPELYELWLSNARLRAETDAYVTRAPFEEPVKVARSGRPWALGSLVAVLGFCAYLASLGITGQVIAGILSVLDVVAILGVFTVLSSDRPRKNPSEQASDPSATSNDLDTQPNGEG